MTRKPKIGNFTNMTEFYPFLSSIRFFQKSKKRANKVLKRLTDKLPEIAEEGEFNRTLTGW